MWTSASLRLALLEKVMARRFSSQIGLEIFRLKVGFSGCSRKVSTVNEMGTWEDEWTDCSNLLDQVVANNNVADNWKWLLHDSFSYKVSSFYTALTSSASVHDIGSDGATLLEILWKTVLPAKVQTFIWRMALDRLPTRSNLMKRRVIDYSQNLDCAFCSSSYEDVSHLFFSCTKSSLVWNMICDWVDIENISEDCCNLHAKV
ncbi:unnamed protein product [Lathyrus sativus]|nr:unnamed protein product [Lathyrus sativus]